MNIYDHQQDINTKKSYPVCNCGRVATDYPPRNYSDFVLKEINGRTSMYDIRRMDHKQPYEAIEDACSTGTFFWTGEYFGECPVFILAAMQGDV